jgi:hypothetical protein
MTTTRRGASRYDVAEGYVKPLDELSVYRSAPTPGFEYNDYTNGGVTGRADKLFLFAKGTTLDQIDPRQRDQAVEVEVRMIGGPVVSLVPIYTPRARNGRALVGPMFGGNFAHGHGALRDEITRTGGGRFYGAVAVHDRFETTEQYAALSD